MLFKNVLVKLPVHLAGSLSRIHPLGTTSRGSSSEGKRVAPIVIVNNPDTKNTANAIRTPAPIPPAISLLAAGELTPVKVGSPYTPFPNEYTTAALNVNFMDQTIIIGNPKPLVITE